MSIFNVNAGIGRLVADRIANQLAGRAIIVGAAGVANRDMYAEIFTPDAAGKVLFAATVDAAIALTTANAGDTIYVLPGHTETVTSTSIALDVAGINIVCLGHGSNRPTFTYGAAAATITVSAANVTWTGGLFVANFLNVAAAFTLSTAKDFKLDGATFQDTSSVLNFVSVLVTGSTDNDADGLRVLNNRFFGLATSPNAFISILGNASRVIIDGNYCDMAATNNVGHFVTLSSKIMSSIRISNNRLIVVGATTATVGIFLTGSGTTSTGIVENNYVASLDTTSELIATAGTNLKFFENYYTGDADASGKLWPIVAAA